MSKLIRNQSIIDIIKDQERRIRILERLIQTLGADGLNIAKLDDITEFTGNLKLANSAGDDLYVVFDATNKRLKIQEPDGTVVAELGDDS